MLKTSNSLSSVHHSSQHFCLLMTRPQYFKADWMTISKRIQSKAINFPMHECIILMMMLVTGPYGHSAFMDLPGNLSIYVLANSCREELTGRERIAIDGTNGKEIILDMQNLIICINIARLSMLIKLRDSILFL